MYIGSIDAPGILLILWNAQPTHNKENPMEQFLNRHKKSIDHVLSGFDRVLFRGILRDINYTRGFDKFLGAHKVLYKDFSEFAQKNSSLIKEHAEKIALKHNRPFQFVPSSQVSKEEIARCIMERDHITEGLICVLYCVEQCMTFSIGRDYAAQKLKVIYEERRCTHFYFYFIDREFGFMHVRIQKWFPFMIQVCINGREWLCPRTGTPARKYFSRENCFVWIEDPEKAQELADMALKKNWRMALDVFAL